MQGSGFFSTVHPARVLSNVQFPMLVQRNIGSLGNPDRLGRNSSLNDGTDTEQKKTGTVQIRKNASGSLLGLDVDQVRERNHTVLPCHSSSRCST